MNIEVHPGKLENLKMIKFIRLMNTGVLLDKLERLKAEKYMQLMSMEVRQDKLENMMEVYPVGQLLPYCCYYNHPITKH
jgi:hypothetical protein